jgi:single-strand DNA-binding protein
MSRSLNRVMLLGNVGRDPEKAVVQSGTPVATFRMATSHSWRDKEGNTHETREWHTVLAWRALSDLVERMIHKGSRVYVEGRLASRSYTDKEGRRVTVTEIHAEDIIVLDNRPPQAAQPSTTDEATPPPSTPHTNTDEIPF